MEECFIASSPRVARGNDVMIVVVYDFQRLRSVLGLGPAIAAPLAVAQGPDIDALAAADLANLNHQDLSDEQIAQAFRAALKHDDAELAGRFATEAIARPSGPADRYPFFNHLLQQAAGRPDDALALLDQAQQADEQSNEGRRQFDYLARRGRILAKKGEIDESYRVFREMLSRPGAEVKHYGPAIEAMLGQKNGPKALELAEEGLTKARSKNDRDSEQYLQELAAAARKLGG
jgi:tetratricopeptide (TPR) repeat protein